MVLIVPAIMIAVLSAIFTMLICTNENIHRWNRFLPSLVILAGGIIYCFILNSRYPDDVFLDIGYLLTFIAITPAIAISLLIILIYKIKRYYKVRKK